MASRKRSPENLGGSSSSGEIGQPVVGDEPCTFIKVRDVLYHCASSGELWLKLLDVARSLKIPTDCIITLEMRLTTKMTTYPGALIEILEAWRGKFSAEATLRTLINILELNKLTGCADALMVHFNVYEDADVVSRRKSTPKSNTWEKLLNHVRHKINTKPLLMNAGATSTSNHDQSSLETGDRDHHVVGDKPSTFVEVRDVLTRCAAVNKLWPKLIEVARSLQIPSETLVSLELRISTNIGTNPDALVEILEAWRGKFSSEATLHMFINVLETNGLGDCADALRMHFKAFDDAYVDLKLKQLGARKNLPDHFKSWMNRKIVEFQGNKVKLEELTPQISTHVDRKIIDELAGGKTPCIRSTSFLNSLIKAGADEEARGNFNSTVLHSAAESVNLTALKYFILRGHDVNVTDDDRQTPLHIAVRLSKETTHEMVVLLVEYGADVNAIDKFGKTPLSIANDNELNVEARTKEYLQIAKMELLLIKWKSEILSHNMDNFSELTNFESRLLQKLTSSGILTERNLEELESIETTLSRANKFYTMLLTKKFDFKMLLSVFSDSNNGAVLSIFVKELINFLYNALMKLEVLVVHHVMHTKGYADVINQFVQTLEEVDRQTYANKLSIVQLLCSLNPETLPPKGTEMYTPLRLVFHSDHMKKWELIQKITTHTVNQSEIQDLVYLCLANTHWHSEVDQRKRIITNTLQNHPYLFKKQSKPYPLLAPKIHVDLIILVINLRVDIRDTNEHKENLLHLCAKYLTPEEYHRVVSTLVEKQQTELFPCRDKEGDIPLHVAVEHLELLDLTIQLFASAKIEFNAVNKYKNTALHRAVLFKRSERILESLIKAGADDQARGQYNRTVLHYAAESGNLTALKYFISRGHDVNVTDEDGYTPLDLALKFSKTNTHEMVLLLVEHGADVNAINALD
ncbi:unnamed protein product [Orchesella dallaii]|uniref:Death domain-containing protein n=1 Tax=Orchesella dallaii TaxID=48710 RepID=A0ABP1RDP9_9HEXA